jgi:hypothetical protein
MSVVNKKKLHESIDFVVCTISSQGYYLTSCSG